MGRATSKGNVAKSKMKHISDTVLLLGRVFARFPRYFNVWRKIKISLCVCVCVRDFDWNSETNKLDEYDYYYETETKEISTSF